MTNLDDALSEFDTSNARAEHALSARATKTILRFFGVNRVPRGSGLEWFRDEYPDFPLHLETRREKIDVARIFHNMIKGKPWKTYIQVLEEHDFGRVGVVMSAFNSRLYVFHNWWNLPPAAGYTRMTRRASSGYSGTIFETLEALLQALKEQGWSP
jgi:hypothetical protein